jgi:hypothetical protein
MFDRIMLQAWKPSPFFCTQTIEPKSFELELGNSLPNSPKKHVGIFVIVIVVVVVVIVIVVIVIVVVIVVVVVVVVVIVIVVVVFVEIIIAFRPKWLKVLLRDPCSWCNNMRHAYVNDVRKTSNMIVETMEFKTGVVVLQ